MRTLRYLTSLTLLVCASASGQKVAATARQQDLDFVANQLPVLNPNFFFQLDRATFQQAIASLGAKISTTTDAEFYVGLAEVVAMAGDAHTSLSLTGSYPSALGFQTLPLFLVWLDDGVFVTDALQPYAQAVGTQLVGVAGMPIDQVVQQLASVISHENDQWVRNLAQQYLTGQQILQGLHIAPLGNAVPMTFRTLAGEEFTLQIAPASGALTTAPDPITGPIADYRRNSSSNHWYSYSPENRLLYFKYNSCVDDPANPFSAFASEVLAALDTNPVDTFVWDFRGNEGGNSSVIQPLGLGLNSRLQALSANPRFRIYLAMDKGTFSAALTNIMSLEQPIPALTPILRTIGEPTGGDPVTYFGNAVNVNLPGSLLVLEYSTVRNAIPAWIPALPSVMPQIPVSIRSTDFFARHDPVIAAILARSAGPPAPPSGGVITVNGASFRVDQGVAPFSFASSFGAFASLPDQVLIGGAQAKIISSATSQVNFLVPSSVVPGSATVSVRAAGAEMGSGQVTITSAGAGIFILDAANPSQPGAIENQDYSVNAAANPARAGSVVQIFATGYGPLDSSGSAPVQVFFGDYPATVLFSGPLSQFPGLWQINAQVPAGVTGQVPLFLIAGNAASNAATIYLQ